MDFPSPSVLGVGVGELYTRHQKHSNKDLTDTMVGGPLQCLSILPFHYSCSGLFLPLKITLLGGESLSKAETTNLLVFRLKSY